MTNCVTKLIYGNFMVFMINLDRSELIINHIRHYLSIIFIPRYNITHKYSKAILFFVRLFVGFHNEIGREYKSDIFDIDLKPIYHTKWQYRSDLEKVREENQRNRFQFSNDLQRRKYKK